VRIHEVCTHCALYRIHDTWAQNPSNGEQGLDSVEYKPSDEKSRRYVDNLKSE
jgi:hypothetical protein